MSKLLNKNNMIKFADYLYKEKNGYVYYQPLCVESLVDYDGKEIKCCVIGEMYDFFLEEPVYISGSSSHGFTIEIEHTTNGAIRKLVDRSVCINYERLQIELGRLSELNDWTNDDEQERARVVSQACKDIAENILL